MGSVNHSLPVFVSLTDHQLDIPKFSPQQILDILNQLQSNKATGPDGIGNFILQATAVSISNPLCKLFNYCLTKQTFPEIWKLAYVTPVHKKNEKMFCQNYRPISLLNNISKIFERAVYNTLYDYLISNNLLNPKNAGFKKGDSTTNQLLYITDKIYKAVDEGKDVRMVFLDAAKAFDKVWHKGLLFKLQQLGISQNFSNWFCSYLTDRQQQVVINGKASQVLTLESGVPQGSILGPLLFLIYINDITNGITTDINLFADDTSLLDIVDDPISSAARINQDLATLHNWATQWLVTFNASKTVIMTFTLKRKKLVYPAQYLNSLILTEVNSHTHLGLHLLSDLSWSNHIQNIVLRATKRVNIMKRLKLLLCRNTLVHIYKTMVRPILEHGCVFFDSGTVHDCDLLESVQYDAVRVCTGALWNTSKSKLLNELGWSLLSVRRQYFKQLQLYKIKKKLVPLYLSEGRLPTVSDVTRYNLRNTDKIRPPKARTNKYNLSFFPSSINTWNRLPPNISNAPTLDIFKKSLSLHLFSASSDLYLSYGQQMPAIYHTQMRLGHSCLNSHAFKFAFCDNDLCSCGQKETVTHYFLHCPIYAALRPTLLTSIANLISPGIN